jgi:hypothetical protein
VATWMSNSGFLGKCFFLPSTHVIALDISKLLSANEITSRARETIDTNEITSVKKKTLSSTIKIYLFLSTEVFWNSCVLNKLIFMTVDMDRFKVTNPRWLNISKIRKFNLIYLKHFV